MKWILKDFFMKFFHTSSYSITLWACRLLPFPISLIWNSSLFCSLADFIMLLSCSRYLNMILNFRAKTPDCNLASASDIIASSYSALTDKRTGHDQKWGGKILIPVYLLYGDIGCQVSNGGIQNYTKCEHNQWKYLYIFEMESKGWQAFKSW